MNKFEILGKTSNVLMKTADGKLVTPDGLYITGEALGGPTFRDEGVYVNSIEYTTDDIDVSISSTLSGNHYEDSSLCLLNVSVSSTIKKS